MRVRIVISGLRLIETAAHLAAKFIHRRHRPVPSRRDGIPSALASRGRRGPDDIGVLRCEVVHGAGLSTDAQTAIPAGAPERPPVAMSDQRSLRHAPWARFSAPEIEREARWSHPQQGGVLDRPSATLYRALTASQTERYGR